MKAKDILKKNFLREDKDSTVNELIGSIKRSGQSTALVFDKGKFIGITSMKKLIKSKIPLKEKIGRLVTHVPSVSPDEDIVDVATLMHHSDSSTLPVISETKVIGVVLANDVIREIQNMGELKDKKVEDIRHPSVKTVKETDRIGKAVEMMLEENVNRLPVVDEANKIVAVISFRDIVDKYLSQPIRRDGGFRSSMAFSGTRGFKGERRDMLALPIRGFESTKDIVTAKPEDRIKTVADLMIKNDISSILVLKKGKPDSIVTKRDLLEVMMNTKKTIVKNIQFIGLNELEDVHPYLKEYIKKISSFYGEKINYMIKNINSIRVHLKEHTKGGKAHKYSVHIQVIAPTVMITSTKAVDWDISRVLHKAFKDVERRIIHKFKSDTSYKKRYY